MSENQLLDANELIGRMERELGRPLTATIELADRCNEVCVHCYQVQGQKGEMSTEQVFELLSELAAAGVLILTLSGGEVLLRRDFFEIATEARRLGFLLRIFTNGLLVTEQVASRFAELAVQTVEISVYSPEAETHDFVTGVPGSHAKTVAGVKALVAVGVPVIVKTPVMSVNAHQLEDYRRFVENLGALLRLSPGDLAAREDATGDPWALNPDDEANRRLFAEQPPSELEPLTPRESNATSCGAGQTIHVESHGEMRPCTLLQLDLGNAAGQGVEKVRSSSAALRGLQRLRWRDLHGCRDCDLGRYCTRCYAKALTETGDALGPHRSACKGARTQFEAHHGVSLTVLDEQGGFSERQEGPYRMIDGSRCAVIPDRVTEQDEALALELGWVRGTPVAEQSAAGLSARPGQLIQLRRPGQRRAVSQQIPKG